MHKTTERIVYYTVNTIIGVSGVTIAIGWCGCLWALITGHYLWLLPFSFAILSFTVLGLLALKLGSLAFKATKGSIPAFGGNDSPKGTITFPNDLTSSQGLPPTVVDPPTAPTSDSKENE